MAITIKQFNEGISFVHNGYMMTQFSSAVGRSVSITLPPDDGKPLPSVRSFFVSCISDNGFQIINSSKRFIYFSDCTVYDEMTVLTDPKPEELIYCPCCAASHLLKK